MEKSVAILLATCNGEAHISEQLASIRQQIGISSHIYIFDDGSRDTTVELVKSNLPTEQYTICSANGWQTKSPARSFLALLSQVDLTKYDFVCFADQDDIWAPGKVSRAIQSMEFDHSEAYSSDLIAFNNESRRSWYLSKSDVAQEYDYIFQGASAGCTYVLSRVAAELVKSKTCNLRGDFPSGRSHDWLIYSICRSNGLKWHLDATAHIFYRQHSANAFGALPSTKGLLARAALAKSGWYREHVLWLREFLVGSPQELEILHRVQRLGFLDRIWLARNCSRFRRKKRDARLLRISILFGIF